jgi:iron(III) transport system substrate-binding protein
MSESAHRRDEADGSKKLTRRGLLRKGVEIGLGTMAGTLAYSSGALTALAGSALDEAAALYAEAKKEGKVVWWTAHYQLSAAEAVRDAFVAKYPGIEVQFIRQTAQVVYQRLTQNLKAGVREVDVFASTDEAHYTTLKKQNVFTAYTPLGVESLPPAFRRIDPDSTYHVGALGFVVINHNSKVTKPPQKWTDLLESKWRGHISLGHPGFSGYVGNWVVALWDKYGWDFFVTLNKNNPKIGRSVNDTVTDIISGERAVGAGPENFSLEAKAKGNFIDIQWPADDAILIVSPVAILKDAPHPNAARLFESFFYTTEYSAALTKTFNYPLRTDVPSASGLAIDQVKWYRDKVERLETGIPDAIKKWRETFGV